MQQEQSGRHGEWKGERSTAREKLCWVDQKKEGKGERDHSFANMFPHKGAPSPPPGDNN